MEQYIRHTPHTQILTELTLKNFSLPIGQKSYNSYHFESELDEETVSEIRSVAHRVPKTIGLYHRSAENKMYYFLDQMPKLANWLFNRIENLHIIGSNFFCSSPTPKNRESLGSWHTGHSLYFGVGGKAMTMWIPLQRLDSKTGGRLNLYNGDYISQIDDLLGVQVRGNGNSISFDHSILKMLKHELERQAYSYDMNAGDILLFDEMLPHQAEKCLITRDVLVLRIVVGPYKLDKSAIKDVLQRYEDEAECNFAEEYLRNLIKYEEYIPKEIRKSEIIEEPPSSFQNINNFLARGMRRLGLNHHTSN